MGARVPDAPLRSDNEKLLSRLSRTYSSGSSGRVRGAEKHEIYAGASAAIFFMTYFHRARVGMAPSAPPPGSATDLGPYKNTRNTLEQTMHPSQATIATVLIYFDNKDESPP